MHRKQITVNILTNVITVVIGAIVGFYLTRYIVSTLGNEAYGFMGLATSFVSYAVVVTNVLNAMVVRYISVRLFDEDTEGATRYFSTAIFANIIMVAILIIPILFLIVFIDRVLSIPELLIWDVRLLFVLIFLNFLVSVFTNVFSVALFAKNKLYLNSLRQMEIQIFKAVLLLICFTFFVPRVWYWGIAGLIGTLYLTAFNIYYCRKSYPVLRVKKKFVGFKEVKDLIHSGRWSSIMQLTSVLNEGLDLLIVNFFMGSTAMGILAVTKVIPILLLQVHGMIASAFQPKLFMLYAKNKYIEVDTYVKRCNKLTGIALAIPTSAFVVFGYEFYSLWMPEQDVRLLWMLSGLAVIHFLMIGFTRMFFDIFIASDKLRLPSIISFGTGLLNVVVVVVLLNITSLGLYAVAGTSSVIILLKVLLFNPIYAAKCLQVRWNTFYRGTLNASISVALMITIGIFVRQVMLSDTWLRFAMCILAFSIASIVVCFFVVFDSSERSIATSIIKRVKFRLTR